MFEILKEIAKEHRVRKQRQAQIDRLNEMQKEMLDSVAKSIQEEIDKEVLKSIMGIKND